MTLTEAKQRIQAIINMADKPGNNLGELICEADSVLTFLAQHEYDKGKGSQIASYQDGYDDGVEDGHDAGYEAGTGIKAGWGIEAGYEEGYHEAKEIARSEKI